MKLATTIALITLAATALAQSANPIEYTPADARVKGYEQRLDMQESSLLKNVEFRSVGPTVMSARVTDLAVDPDDPTRFYVAYASGGVWKTTNNGQSFDPLFEGLASMTVGDIAAHWDSGTLYVGAGENNSSRSSYAGTGVYKTTDDGETWEWLGLAETHRAGRIVIHPDDPDVVWYAAAGHLYSDNPERGVYKTTDGGKTWRHTLFVDAKTGAIDLVANPNNPDELYAAMWTRERRAWNFVESGEGSGIYKSTDGGETWTLVTDEASGFPTGEGVGRIGLALYDDGERNFVYAFLDNQYHREEKEKETFAVTKDVLRDMSVKKFLELEDQEINNFLDRESFPKKYNAAEIKEQVRKGELGPLALVEYLEDANRQLFDVPVIGAEVYRSADGGESWTRTHEDYIDDMVYSYGYYFGEIRVAPYDPDKLYITGVPLLASDDGGATWRSLVEDNVHVDFHALWVDPEYEGRLIVGDDGGVNISYDDGETWIAANSAPVGQFYTVAYDMDSPYNIYGGLQDNGVWYGPSAYSASKAWHITGDYPYDKIMGGDGFQVQVDFRDNTTVYTGFQFGHYYRVNKLTKKSDYITPKHELGERPYRWNWQTPIHLSRHHQDILYMGSNKFHRSMDKGENWFTNPKDLTAGGAKGNVPYGTLTTIDESPLRFGLIYTGGDDGKIHVSTDAGESWRDISDGIPSPYWVTRVAASAHDEATVYVSLNGYRWDNFEALVFRSTDYGATWTRIGEDLPLEPVNVVKEDPENERVLYVGTDHLVYVSLDGGETFQAMDGGLPHAPAHDLVAHPREKDLIVGTHGRSIYVADVEYIQKLTPEILAKPLHFFDLGERTWSDGWGDRGWGWSDPNEPTIDLVVYVEHASEATVRATGDDMTLREFDVSLDAGLNFVEFDFTIDANAADAYAEAIEERLGDEEIVVKPSDNGKTYLRPGDYEIVFETADASASNALKIKRPKKSKRGE